MTNTTQPDSSAKSLDWLAIARKHGYAFPDARMQDFVAELLRSRATTPAPQAATTEQAGLPAGWRDKLRWSKANTDYHGLVAFTPAQLEHFVSMLTSPAATTASEALHGIRDTAYFDPTPSGVVYYRKAENALATIEGRDAQPKPEATTASASVECRPAGYLMPHEFITLAKGEVAEILPVESGSGDGKTPVYFRAPAPSREAAPLDERARKERENAEFTEWWVSSGQQAAHDVVTENAAHAAWQERARRAALAQPAAPVVDGGDECRSTWKDGYSAGFEAAKHLFQSKPVVDGELPGVDWLGLSLDLEAQAKRVESQTVERAMLAAARWLRLMGEAVGASPHWTVWHNGKSATAETLSKCMAAAHKLRTPEEAAVAATNLAAAIAADEAEERAEQHPDDAAVDRFAAAMKAKMAASRARGRGGWDDPAQCTVEKLAYMLVEHVEKGDPVDIANFAMMVQLRGGCAIDVYEALAVFLNKRQFGAQPATDTGEFSECDHCCGTGIADGEECSHCCGKGWIEVELAAAPSHPEPAGGKEQA